MGLSINMNPSPPESQSLYLTHKIFLFCNYILMGASSSCIFLTLSLRLVPSIFGFFFILLHIITISVAICWCTAATYGSNKWYSANMATTVLTAIFQGSVSAMIFMETSNFLGFLKSYVREEDGSVILRMAGGLCVLIFCLEWVVLTLSFVLRYNAFVEGNLGSNGSVDARSKPLFNV